jgi:polyisoprenoid-binding protein YceI
VDNSKSSIKFAGEHAENPFKGAFESWKANIQFDATKLEESALDVTIDTASAKTGNAMYDGTLPTADWFDVKETPNARFISKSITRVPDGSYRADGTLTIRGVSKPFTLPFTLDPKDAAGKEVQANAVFSIDRLAFDVGKQSDGKAEWVGRDIDISLHIVAFRL